MLSSKEAYRQMILCTLLFQLKENAWMWLCFWDFLGWKCQGNFHDYIFFQRYFVLCDVKGLLSSVSCQVEIRLECIILPAVTLQAAADVIPSAYAVLTAGLALQHMEAPISQLPSQPVTHQVLALTVIGKGIHRISARAFEHFFLGFFVVVSTGPETSPDSTALDNSFNEQESIQSQKSPLSESIDVKPSEMSLALPLPIGTEDHQMLLPVTGSQSPSSETLLRSAVTGYSEPQFIFLQQLY